MTEKIKRLTTKLQEAKKQEQSITDKYSTNYKDWQKACDKVNRLKTKLNKLTSEYNYDKGSSYGFNIVV